jgi:soluble lytic murein transglycosylase-like protein
MILATVIALALLAPVQGHTQSEYDEWLLDWQISYHADGPFAHEMRMVRDDFLRRHPNGPTVPQETVTRSSSSSPIRVEAGTEQWRPLVSAYFGDGTDRALCLMGHESGGDPGARNTSSGAAGLMQVMPFWAPDYGVSYQALFDPETNIRIAKGIRDQQGWGAWSPYNRGLCH